MVKMKLEISLLYVCLIWSVRCHGRCDNPRQSSLDLLGEFKNNNDDDEDSNGSKSAFYAFPMTSSLDNLCLRKRDEKEFCICYPKHLPIIRRAECWFSDPHIITNGSTWKLLLMHADLRELEILIPLGNLLVNIPPMIFAPLKNLTTLTIKYANIEGLQPNTFKGLQLLEDLSLECTQLKILKENTLVDLPRLRTLNLQKNEIQTIERGAFRNLSVLDNVSLQWNKLTAIPEGIFDSSMKIVYLALSENEISHLASSNFKDLGNLKFLHLDSNKLTSLGSFVFIELWELEELNLSNNSISQVSNRAFEGLTNLRILNLQMNKIKELQDDTFRTTTSLFVLLLQNNSLKSLSRETVEPIFENLKKKSGVIAIGKNNIICDCKLEWVYELSNKKISPMLNKMLNEIVCVLMYPKLDDFKVPIPINVLTSIHQYRDSEEEIEDRLKNRQQKYYELSGTYLKKNPFPKVPKRSVAQNSSQKLLGKNVTEKLSGMTVPLNILKREALVCPPEPVVSTENPPSNDISASEKLGTNIFQLLTIINISIMICIIFYALIV